MDNNPIHEDIFDVILKVVLIGDSGVGKSNLLSRYTRNEFNLESKSTIGVEFATRSIKIDGKQVKAQIWDTAGQERFRTITTAYYRGAMGILLVYDITNEKSFDNIKTWIQNIKQHASEDVEKMILGNKCDMEDKRHISTEQGQRLAAEHGVEFMETSAKSNINVEEAFVMIARKIKAKMDTKSVSMPQASSSAAAIRPAQTDAGAEKRGCC